MNKKSMIFPIILVFLASLAITSTILMTAPTKIETPELHIAITLKSYVGFY